MNNKAYRIIMSILPAVALLHGCMGTGEIEDPSNFRVPSVTLNEAAKSEKTIAVSLSASYSSSGKYTKVSECGFYYSKNSDFGQADKVNCTADSSRKFTTALAIKEYGATYFFKAYISDGRNEILSESKSFTTGDFGFYVNIGELTASTVSRSEAKVSCVITAATEVQISEKGVCYGTTTAIDLTSSHISAGAGAGMVDVTIPNLSAGVQYYVCGYAKDGDDIKYGTVIPFSLCSSPSIRTADVTSITPTSANCGGLDIADYDKVVNAKGVVWSTEHNPTVSLPTRTSNGTGSGNFTATMNGLNPGTTYYVRAYATNSEGTGYGEEKSFTTDNLKAPTVSTTEISNIASSTVTVGGNVSADGGVPVTARGLVWSTDHNPTIILSTKSSNGTGTGSFIGTISGLTPGTTYYVRAYATNSAGTGYGEEKSFTTDTTPADLATTSVSNVTSNSATVSGNISSTGGDAVSERGVVYATHEAPTISDGKVASGSGTGSFSASITGLVRATTYYARAYAVNSKGTAYGNQIAFTTNAEAPEVSTTAASSIMATSATTGGNVLSDGGSTVTVRGVVYGTSSSPTVSLPTKTVDGSGTGTFTSYLTGLQPDTKYYVRAYATNGIATVYGNEESFTTGIALPSVSTADLSSISSVSAVSGGNVTNAGGGTISVRGVVWSTSENPTVSLSTKTSDGSGTGTFTSSITGLNKNTTYYVRAYATNEAGTAYGEQKSFKTNATGGNESVGGTEYEW